MKKNIIKAIILFVMFAIGIFIIPTIVNANSINQVKKLIKINNNGDAEVVEIWETDITSGTEIYVPYGHLVDSKFENLSVSDDRGITYETIKNWNPKDSFDNKKDKCGINKTDEGIELCWGISEYGKRTYRISYNITNFVVQSKDYQYTYFCLFPKMSGISINSVQIQIKGIKDYTYDDIQFWGYGNNGTREIKDGIIVFDSQGSLRSSDYMTVLIKYEENDYETTSIDNRKFEEIKNIAMKGTNYSYNSYNNKGKGIIYAYLASFAIPVIVFLLLTIKSIKRWLTKTIYKREKPIGLRLTDINNIPYYRDIPSNGNIIRAFYIAKVYNIINDRSSLFGALLLKWLKEGLIEIREKKPGSDSYEVKFLNSINTIQDTNEIIVWKLFIDAARFNQTKRKSTNETFEAASILETKEFEKYCKKNYNKVLNAFKQIENNINSELYNSGLIREESNTYKRLFRKIYVSRSVYTEELQQEARNIMGLKKFLLNYSLINQRENMEVELWDMYLVFAEVLEIADKVEKQFEKVYPDYRKVSKIAEKKNIAKYSMEVALSGIDAADKAQKRKMRLERLASVMESSGSSSDSNDSRDSGRGSSSNYSGGGSDSRGSSSSSGGIR